MIDVFANRHVSKQSRARQAAFDRFRQTWCGGYMSLTILTSIFQPDVFDDMQARGRVIELLTRFTTDFFALFATAGTTTSLFVQIVDDLLPWQGGGQLFATTRADRRRNVRRLWGHG